MAGWAKAGLELWRHHPAVLLATALPLVLLELGMVILGGGVLPLPLPTLEVASASRSVLGLVLGLLLTLGVAPLLRVGLQLVAYGLRRGQPVPPSLVLLPLVRRPGPVLLTVWTVWIGVLLMSLLLIVPGILCALSWTFAPLLALALVNPVDDSRSISAELTRGHRGRLFLLLLLVTVVGMVGDVVAVGLGDGRPWLGFAVWVGMKVFSVGWSAGVLAAAFDQLLNGHFVEVGVRAELERALTFWRWSIRPAWALPPLVGALAMLVHLAPKGVWNSSELVEVSLLPSSPPPAGALVALGTGKLRDMVILPDEERLLLLTWQGIEVRRLPDLEPLQFIPRTWDWSWSCVVSPTGDLVALQGAVVDLASGEVIARYPRGEAEAFDPSGRELLVAQAGRGERPVVLVRGHDPRTGEELWKAEFEMPPFSGTQVKWLELSPQLDEVLIVLDAPGLWPSTHILDRATGVLKASYKGVGTFLEDGTLVVTDEGRLRLIRLGDQGPAKELVHKGTTSWVIFTGYPYRSRTLASRDGQRVAAVVLETAEAVVWDLAQEKPVFILSLFSGRTRAAIPRLRVGSFFVPIPWVTERERLTYAYGIPWSLHLSPSGRWLALASSFEPRVILVDLEAGKVQEWHAIALNYPPLWLPDSRTLLTEGMILWNAHSGKPLGALWPGKGIPWAVSPDGRLLLTSDREELSVWAIGVWRKLATHELPGQVRHARFGPGPGIATVVVEAGVLRVEQIIQISLKHGSVIRRWILWPNEKVLALSPSGRYALLVRGSQLAVMEVETGKQWAEWCEPSEAWPICGEFSPDERLLAVSYRGDGVKVLDLATGECRRLADFFVRDLAFHPQGKVLAGLKGGEAVVAWDLASGQEVHRLPHATYGRLAFSPDGSRLAVADGVVILWPWPPQTASP